MAGHLVVEIGPGEDDGTDYVWAAWRVDIDQVTSVPDPITAVLLSPLHPASSLLRSTCRQLAGTCSAIPLPSASTPQY